MIHQRDQYLRACEPRLCGRSQTITTLFVQARHSTYLLAYSKSALALRLLLIFLVLELHRLHLAGISIADQRIVRDGQRPQVSRMRLSSDEGVRRGLQGAMDP